MRSKYPGSIIRDEIGSISELAGAYGVSERTIYRWLNKADRDRGITKYPGAAALKKDKSTRKEMAAKYGVSERTIYRWLNKATGQKSTTTKTKYPGREILAEKGTNKELAEKYKVSVRTVYRWKAKARAERLRDITSSEDILPPETSPEETPTNTPENTEEEEFEEFIEKNWIPPQEADIPPEEFEDFEEEFDEEDDSIKNLRSLSDILLSDPDLISSSSIFRNLTPEEQLQYLDFYIQYQFDLDEHQFYNPETHELDTSAEFVSNINIWGSEFEEWAEKQFNSSIYEV